MAKRKVTLDQLRDLVRARRTKGSAFMLNALDYIKQQDSVRAELEAMSYADILAKYPEYTFDIKAR